jgi:hypothetical protein
MFNLISTLNQKLAEVFYKILPKALAVKIHIMWAKRSKNIAHCLLHASLPTQHKEQPIFKIIKQHWIPSVRFKNYQEMQFFEEN